MQVAEQPRAALAAAADDDAVHAGLADHPDRVLGGPDVAVAEDRDVRQRLAQPGNGGPVGLAGIELAAVRPCRATAATPESRAIRPASR